MHPCSETRSIQIQIDRKRPRIFKSARSRGRTANFGGLLFAVMMQLLHFLMVRQNRCIIKTKLSSTMPATTTSTTSHLATIGDTSNVSDTAKADAAKKAKILLDVLSVARTAATALTVIKEKIASGAPPSRRDVIDMDIIISSLRLLVVKGRRAAAKVSPVAHLQRAYDMRMRSSQDKVYFASTTTKPLYLSNELWTLRCFANSDAKVKKAPAIPITPPNKTRQSTREVVVSPPLDTKQKQVELVLKGRPPHPMKTWTRDALASALVTLEGTRMGRQFMKKVVSLGNSPYQSTSGIHYMYQNWKRTNTTRNRGRPFKVTVDEAEEAVRKCMKERTSDSSAFRIKNMKAAYSSKIKARAEQDGLEPETVSTNVHLDTAKAMMLAAAMGDNVGTFTAMKLLPKTESRFRSEHSVLMGYAYACTVLATHFIEGPIPRSLKKYRPDKLDAGAVETMDWMKTALAANSIYPVNPNLVLSTDDTTLFAFEGTANSEGGWDWKIVPGNNRSANVRSDFEVSEDSENSGGLRVRLTFTFTAAGLSAPPYIAISGLTNAELSPELCRDGILATKVPGLCKGGDDISNSGFGWLVFLRADKKDETDADNAKLSVANKKIIHYNDDVLMPFIRDIRKKLGWTPGQEVQESLKAVSWFDGDIGQLQTMLYEAREATDETHRIVRNKHSAAATGTQQPCDLSPVFRTLRQLQKNATAVNDNACGLAEDISELFAVHLREHGLNLDGNRRKKKALIDFLLCLPELLESVLKKRHIKKSFVEAGMIDEATGHVPVFEKLIGTCKRWVSVDKDLGIPRCEKQHCRNQFQSLMEIQLKEGQVSYPEMKAVGIPIGAFIFRSVIELCEDRNFSNMC